MFYTLYITGLSQYKVVYMPFHFWREKFRSRFFKQNLANFELFTLYTWAQSYKSLGPTQNKCTSLVIAKKNIVNFSFTCDSTWILKLPSFCSSKTPEHEIGDHTGSGTIVIQTEHWFESSVSDILNEPAKCYTISRTLKTLEKCIRWQVVALPTIQYRDNVLFIGTMPCAFWTNLYCQKTTAHWPVIWSQFTSAFSR